MGVPTPPIIPVANIIANAPVAVDPITGAPIFPRLLGDMGDISTASWDPIFWFHHSNVERMFCTWQQNNPKPTDASLVAPSGALGKWVAYPWVSYNDFVRTPGMRAWTAGSSSGTLADWFPLEDVELIYKYDALSYKPSVELLRSFRSHRILTVSLKKVPLPSGKLVVTIDGVVVGSQPVFRNKNPSNCANCRAKQGHVVTVNVSHVPSITALPEGDVPRGIRVGVTFVGLAGGHTKLHDFVTGATLRTHAA